MTDLDTAPDVNSTAALHVVPDCALLVPTGGERVATVDATGSAADANAIHAAGSEAHESAAAAAALSLDELESRMCLLAGRIAAQECEFLVLLAEYDERQGWGAWELRSAAHWLSARCGMRLGAARERVRVARALTLLPGVREAFAAGQLVLQGPRSQSRRHADDGGDARRAGARCYRRTARAHRPVVAHGVDREHLRVTARA